MRKHPPVITMFLRWHKLYKPFQESTIHHHFFIGASVDEILYHQFWMVKTQEIMGFRIAHLSTRDYPPVSSNMVCWKWTVYVGDFPVKKTSIQFGDFPASLVGLTETIPEHVLIRYHKELKHTMDGRNPRIEIVFPNYKM